MKRSEGYEANVASFGKSRAKDSFSNVSQYSTALFALGVEYVSSTSDNLGVQGRRSENPRAPSSLFDNLLKDGSFFSNCDSGLFRFYDYFAEAWVKIDSSNFSFHWYEFPNVSFGFSFGESN